MADFNGNNVYITIDGVDVSTKFKSVSLESSIESEDVTAGAGATHIQRAEKLRDHTISITLSYDKDGINGYIANLRPGKHTVIVGPEGNTAGKPKHEQDFILTSNSFEQGVDKPRVVFDISGEAADAPVTDLFNGGTF